MQVQWRRRLISARYLKLVEIELAHGVHGLSGFHQFNLVGGTNASRPKVKAAGGPSQIQQVPIDIENLHCDAPFGLFHVERTSDKHFAQRHATFLELQRHLLDLGWSNVAIEHALERSDVG